MHQSDISNMQAKPISLNAAGVFGGFKTETCPFHSWFKMSRFICDVGFMNSTTCYGAAGDCPQSCKWRKEYLISEIQYIRLFKSTYKSIWFSRHCYNLGIILVVSQISTC